MIMYMRRLTSILMRVSVAIFAVEIALIMTFGFYGMFSQMLRLS